MKALELILVLLAASAALRVLAERLTIPYAALLVVGGFLLALIPGLPRVTLPPEVLFLVFVPPLLYTGATMYPLRELKRQLAPILRLAVVMVIVSTFAVAAAAHALSPEFTWAAAFTLGAIVSPPDPVAVLSVMRAVRAPRPIISILEGEGLINDATALVIYRFAIAAAVTRVFSVQHAALEFVFDAILGVAVGVIVGVIVAYLHRFTRRIPAVSSTLSLLTPFASYLLAELLGVSGVLAVVTTGLYAGRQISRILGPDSRVQLLTTWATVAFLLESLIFILVGLELSYLIRTAHRAALTDLLREALVVSVVVVLVRLAWIVPSSYFFRAIGRKLRGGTDPLPPLRIVLFVAWAGLRGGDSLVLALSVPLTIASGAPFPAREQIIFITFGVIFMTLVLQGPTLAPLARRLAAGTEEQEDLEEAHARVSVAEAGLRVIDEGTFDASTHPEVVRYLKKRQLQRARRWAAREQRPMTSLPSDLRPFETKLPKHDHLIPAPSHDSATLDEERAEEYRRVRSVMLVAEEQEVTRLRDQGVIADDVMRRIVRDLDLEALLLETSEPVGESIDDVPSSIDADAR